MQESDFEPRMSWSKVASECSNSTDCPFQRDIMYQGPGGCIVDKYNVTKKVCLQSQFSEIVWNAQSREGWAAKVCQAAKHVGHQGA